MVRVVLVFYNYLRIFVEIPMMKIMIFFTMVTMKIFKQTILEKILFLNLFWSNFVIFHLHKNIKHNIAF